MVPFRVIGPLSYAIGNNYLIACTRGLTKDAFVGQVLPFIPLELTKDTDRTISLGLAVQSGNGFDITPIFDLRFLPKDGGIQLEAMRYTNTDGDKPNKVFDSGEHLTEAEFIDYKNHYVPEVIETLWREYVHGASA